MGVNSITGTTTNNYETKTKTYKKETSAAASGTTSMDTAAKDTGVIYEKSTDTKTSGVTKKTDTALVAKLKADAEERTSQLRSLVEKMMTKQGIAIGTADDMWKFLAKGDFTVDAETKAQAEADIAEDGYWGVEQTSERILDFAKALSGNDPDKADLLLDAFKKGFKEATKTWGDELPDISKRTYDAVLEKFDKWKNGTSDTTTDATETN